MSPKLKPVLAVQYPDGHTLHGHDFRRNMDTAWDLDGHYATDVFTDEALRIIHAHDDSKPLFLYLSHLAVHSGNAGKLLEAPQEVIDKFGHIPEPNRRTYAGKYTTRDHKSDMLLKYVSGLSAIERHFVKCRGYLAPYVTGVPTSTIYLLLSFVLPFSFFLTSNYRFRNEAPEGECHISHTIYSYKCY
jgi:hypothetical protein